ncbi:MAG TPA: hypothetical protein VFE29_06585, partial [Terriglobia bacterium]|nr:hypothetical protein [Terriglobia bacterium]
MRTLAVVISTLLFMASVTLAENWPHWRGPSRDGVSREVGLPAAWGAKCATASIDSPRIFGTTPIAVDARVSQRGQGGFGGFGGFGQGRPIIPLGCTEFAETNIAWKLRLPAYSGSTPIIWGDMIFLNMATEANRGELELWAIDRRTKAVAWKK